MASKATKRKNEGEPVLYVRSFPSDVSGMLSLLAEALKLQGKVKNRDDLVTQLLTQDVQRLSPAVLENVAKWWDARKSTERKP
jgi:hypothetical protein